MQAGDWVTTFERKYNQLAGKYVEDDLLTERIKKRTAKIVKVPRYHTPFKETASGSWEAKTGYCEWRYLRPSTPEEIAQGEVLERDAAEKAQQRKDAAKAIRLKLPGVDWSAINDATVERIQEMVNDERNRIQLVQLKLRKGKGKR